MKTVLFSLATCLGLFAAPAAAAPSTSDYTQLVQIIDQAERAFSASQPFDTYLAQFQAEVPNFVDADLTKREHLQKAIDELIERAKKAQPQLEDFWRMKGMTIDAKCSTAIRQLWKEAKGRKATRQQFEYVANLLRERADAAKEHPDLRALVQAEIDKLMKRYLDSESISDLEYAIVQDETIRSMLDRALFWLEEMAKKRHATREQFLYVKTLMIERARNFSENAEWRRLMSRVESELERMMNRDLSTVAFDRAEYEKLREMLMKKAREVMGGVGTG